MKAISTRFIAQAKQLNVVYKFHRNELWKA